jgi:hypothetical protein
MKTMPQAHPVRDSHTNGSNINIHRPRTIVSLKQIETSTSNQRDCHSASLSSTETTVEETPKPYIHLKSCVRTPASTTGTPISRRTVSFHTVEIREYVRTLGDNPSVRSGPALSLGWLVVNSCILPLSLYEHQRPPKVGSLDLIVPRIIREEMLREEGITRSEIAAAIRESFRIKQNRNQTVQQAKYCTGQPFKALARIWKSIYDRIGHSGKTDKQVELLLQQGKCAEQVRDQLRQAHLQTLGIRCTELRQKDG